MAICLKRAKNMPKRLNFSLQSDESDRLLDNEVVILHTFIKKTNAIPKKELDIALKRQKDLK